MEKVISLTKKDFKVQTFQAGGKGGQKQNKTSSGVRIIHPASGARGECREERSQLQNKKIAFERLTKTHKFKYWLSKQHKEKVQGITIEEKVEKMLRDENLKVEGKDDNGNWVELTK